MVIFFFKFIVFRVLENALVNQKIRSRHFLSYLLSRALLKVFVITSPGSGKLFLCPDSIFWKYFKGVWYYCQYVNICCLSFTFKIFIRSSLTIHRCLHISWDGRTILRISGTMHSFPLITLWKLFFRCPNSFVKDVFQQQLLESFKSIRLVM